MNFYNFIAKKITRNIEWFTIYLRISLLEPYRMCDKTYPHVLESCCVPFVIDCNGFCDECRNFDELCNANPWVQDGVKVCKNCVEKYRTNKCIQKLPVEFEDDDGKTKTTYTLCGNRAFGSICDECYAAFFKSRRCSLCSGCFSHGFHYIVNNPAFYCDECVDGEMKESDARVFVQ